MNEVPKAERPKRQRFSRRDFVAGLTNAVTNIPDAMANAVLAGVNPVCAHGGDTGSLVDNRFATHDGVRDRCDGANRR
jgi:hypothetical protein